MRAIAGAVLLHVGAIVGVVLFAASTPLPEPAITQVTLVAGDVAHGQEANGDTPDLKKLLANLGAQLPAPPPQSPAPRAEPAHSRLDDLFGPKADPAPTSRSASDEASQPVKGPLRPYRLNGSARPIASVGRGESLAATDLYAAASLPPVGQRPATVTKGDIWRQVAPCWRPISPAAATIVVEIDRAGRIVGQPLSLRRSAPTPADLLAERSAIRALQACAPYPGVSALRWRLNFPGRAAANS